MSLMVRFTSRAFVLASLIAGVGLTSLPASAQQRVGVNAAVNPAATGSPPGAVPRRLVLGQEVVFNERVATDLQGQTQILFLDQSTMTVGPNSDLLIDEFVFDPAAGTGKMAANLTRGVFRFVGGRLSKQDNAVTMQTPSATIGIRGGVILVRQANGGALEVIFVYGRGATVTGLNGVVQTVTRPGWEITVAGPGASPSEPAPAPPGAAAAMLAQLDGRSGGNGGATTIPTEAMVASSGIAQAIQQGPQIVVQTQPPNVNTAVQLAQTQIQVTANQPSQLAQAQIQVTANQPAQIGGGDGSAGGGGGSAGGGGGSAGGGGGSGGGGGGQQSVTYAGIFKSTNGNGSTLGFTGQTSPAQIAFTNATLTNNVLTIPSSALGGSGQLTIPLVPGSSSFTSANTASPLGPVNGTSFLSTDGTFFYANLTPANSPTQREFVAGGLPVGANALAATGSTRIVAFTVQPDAALQSNIPFIRANTGGNLANAYVSPLYLVAPPNTAIGNATTGSAARLLQASLAITGQGANQQSVLVTAFGTVASLQSSGQPVVSGAVRGSSQLSPATPPVRIGSALSSTVDGNGNSLYGGANAVSGFVLDQTQYNTAAAFTPPLTTPVIPSTASEVPLSGTATNYGFTQPATAASLPTGVGASRTTQTLTGYFGGVMNTTAQTTPYVITGTTSLSTDATNNRVAATLTSNPNAAGTTLTMQFGGLTGSAGGREAFVDDNIYGAAESVTQPQQVNGQDLVVGGDTAQAGKLYLLSSGAAPPPNSLLPSGASYCQCQYLQWGYWGGDLRTGNSTNNNISRIDRGGINFWTAGQITPLGDISTLAAQGATGLYNGHMIGSVFNNGNQYIAAGGVSATYHFGTQMGSFAVNNYDGRSFTATGSPIVSNGGRSYQFGLNNVPGISGAFSGSFYGSMAAETGGNFAFQTTAGPTYLTSGIFAAKR